QRRARLHQELRLRPRAPARAAGDRLLPGAGGDRGGRLRPRRDAGGGAARRLAHDAAQARGRLRAQRPHARHHAPAAGRPGGRAPHGRALLRLLAPLPGRGERAARDAALDAARRHPEAQPRDAQRPARGLRLSGGTETIGAPRTLTPDARPPSDGGRLRVALVTETFLPKVDGVVTRLVATLEALARQGHEVLVLAPPGAPKELAGHRVLAAPGVPFPWYPEHTAARPAPALARAVTAFAPDVVHVVNPVFFGAWGAWLARRRRLPLLASFHTDPKVVERLGLAWFKRPLEVLDRELHNLADVNLCTSPQMVAL